MVSTRALGRGKRRPAPITIAHRVFTIFERLAGPSGVGHRRRFPWTSIRNRCVRRSGGGIYPERRNPSASSVPVQRTTDGTARPRLDIDERSRIRVPVVHGRGFGDSASSPVLRRISVRQGAIAPVRHRSSSMNYVQRVLPIPETNNCSVVRKRPGRSPPCPWHTGQAGRFDRKSTKIKYSY